MKENRLYKSLNMKTWFKPKRGGKERTIEKDTPWNVRQEVMKKKVVTMEKEKEKKTDRDSGRLENTENEEMNDEKKVLQVDESP